MAHKVSARWAFNIATWRPSESDILLATSCIQPEEKNRLSKFVFRNDCMSSLIGRLLLRKYIHYSTGISYGDIQMDRDTKGKPVLKNREALTDQVHFNVSHQGDYVVLAGEFGKTKVGIDVMKLEAPINKNISEFFRLMTRQFSHSEWQTIKHFTAEKDCVASFYRHWCLKESYVKNTGVGITIPLAELSFKVTTEKLHVDKVITDTTLQVRGRKIENWIFEETLLDPEYGVAVALDLNGETYKGPTRFKFMTFEELMGESVPFYDEDKEFCKNFFSKSDKH